MNNVVVMKFGGTSVGSTLKISDAARRVVKYAKETELRPIVVVSAMSGETDRLTELCRTVGGSEVKEREYSQVVTAGEQISAGLMALAIEREGCQSASLLAYQVGMRTVKVHGRTLIASINAEVMEELLNDGVIPVVAGFQGVDADGALSTLSRGGSDTTAVAVAAALKAQECIILTDVDGVYTALPSICRQARKLDYLSYEEMLELAKSGAKVLQARSVHLARKFKVPLLVCSSFEESPGTLVVESYEGMEDAVVSGITCSTAEARITLRNIPDSPEVLSEIFYAIGEKDIVVDMIVQNRDSDSSSMTVSFTVPEDDATEAHQAVSAFVSKKLPNAVVDLDKGIAKLSVVGEGMRAYSGVAAEMFSVLAREGISIDLITTSEIKISVAIAQKYSELAVRALHEAFVENK